jgi:hypothetical protein
MSLHPIIMKKAGERPLFVALRAEKAVLVL